MLKKDQAICLRRADYSETSQVVTLFARNTGKISTIAKGSKRPKSAFDGPIELLSFGDIVFSLPDTDKLATLTEFQQKPAFLQLRTRLFVLNCSLFAIELLDAFTQEQDPHPELFDMLIQFLTDIQDTEDDFGSLGLLVLFQLTLLNETGTKPVLNQCANCKNLFSEKWPAAYFSSSANGLLCPDCEQAFSDKVRLTKECAVCLADIKLINNATRRNLNEIQKLLIYYFTELMHRKPKMAKHFLKK